MKKIIAINASPRPLWNTGSLVRSAAEGVKESGAEVKVIDLYKLDKFTGCISCFGCKRGDDIGRCVYKDALYPVLEEIRNADGLILGTPNYFGDVSAGLRALYERLVFQYHSYKTEEMNYNKHFIPVLLIMTSNVPKENYAQVGYDALLKRYQRTLGSMIGKTKLMISGNTLQVSDYDKYLWTMFNPEEKKLKHENEFPKEKKEAYSLGALMVTDPW